MDTKTTIPISQARKNIFALVEDVQTPGTIYTVTEKGYPKAVIMSAEEFESWNETLEVIKDFPNLKKDIKRSLSEYKRGEYVTLDQLTRGTSYALSSHRPKKRTKKS